MAFSGVLQFLGFFFLVRFSEAFVRGSISGDFGRGRPDVFFNGEWGSIGNTGWDNQDAAVFCHSLGFRSGTAIPSSELYNRRNTIWLDNLDCVGNETSLDECPHLGWGKLSVNPEDPPSQIIAGVQCFDDYVRISGGRSQGRAEINNGQWGSIDAASWHDEEAAMFCSTLGFKTGKASNLPPVPVSFEDFHCSGSETSLNQCQKQTVFKTLCRMDKNVAGVKCQGAKVQIAGGRKKGRAEIYNNHKWGTICDVPGNNDAATVFCRMLGFWTGRYPSQAESPALPNTPIWFEKFICTGNETTLAQCGYENFENTSCTHEQDIQVSCSHVKARIADSNSSLGRAELFYKGQWLPICSHTMTQEVAKVFCRTLGLGLEQINNSTQDIGSGLSLLSLNCTGEEDSIQECRDITWSSQGCGGDPNAHIQCSTVIAEKSLEDEVILYFDDKTIPVCPMNWDDIDAKVFCRMFGFREGTALEITSSSSSPVIFTPNTFMTNVNCLGDEFSLLQCPYELSTNDTCEYDKKIAGANCTGSLVRLVSVPDNENKGRAEIFYDGQWGSICSDFWDDKASSVFCRMLGYKKGVSFDPYDANIPENSGPVWLSDVTCTGEEGNILQCGHTDWADHQCIHEYDMGVECSN